MKTPKSLDLDVTSRCNLKCKYCFHRTSPGDTGKELSTDSWRTFIDELGRAAVMKVTFGGGEPFIRNDLTELIDEVVKNRMRFSILSNGSYITPDIANHIAKTGRCDSIQISIDGSCSEIHDKMRGSGAFEKAVRGIKTLQAAGVPVTSRVTIHRFNLNDLENIAQFLLDDIGLNGITTNSVCHIGLAKSNEEEVSLTAIEQSIAMERLLCLAKRYNNRITSSAGPLSQGKGFYEMEKARIEGRTISGGGYLTGCGCMWSNLAVRPDGVIVPCGMLAHIELGRIIEDSIIDIWQNHPELNRLRQRYKIPLTDFNECRECNYLMVCTGNCPASSYTRTGNVFSPSPDGCLKKYLESGGRIVNIP